MSKSLKAILSNPSRGNLARPVATVSIGEVAEPPPPPVADNHEFYETWHNCWITDKFSSPSSTIIGFTVGNFQKGYEYMIAAVNEDGQDEMGWSHFFVPHELANESRKIQASGQLDGDIFLNIDTGTFTVDSGKKVNLVKLICRPIRVIKSEAERKYPTDWLLRTISASYRSSFNWEHDKEYVGFTRRFDVGKHAVYRCATSKIPVGPGHKLGCFMGVTSYNKETWVEFQTTNSSNSPVTSGAIESRRGRDKPNLKYLYERNIPYSTTNIPAGDTFTWKRIYYNPNDTTSLATTWSDMDEFLIVQGDFAGDNEVGCGILIMDRSIENHARFDKNDGYCTVTGPDSWVKLVGGQNKLYSKETGAMVVVYRRKLIISNAAPTGSVPNLTIPSEGG